MGKIAFDRRWVFCFWTLMFGCQRNMVIHVNNGWKLGLKSSTVANDGEQWWTTDKLWFDTFWYVFDTTVPAVVACLAAHSVGYKPSFRWSGQVLFSQHRVATQRVGGKDGRRLGVPKTEPKKRRVDRPRAHWLLYPSMNFKTRSNGQNPSDSWLLRILLNQASTHLMHVGVRTTISWVCSNWNASTSAVQNFTLWLFNEGMAAMESYHFYFLLLFWGVNHGKSW
jgi:hypothetical protein